MSLIVNAPAAPSIGIENAAVAITRSSVLRVDDTMIDEVVAQARKADRRRSRLLLHRSPNELLHEMVIALPRESCDVPHMNFRSGKSFQVLRGRMAVMVFAEDGTSVTPYHAGAGASGMPSLVRLNDPCYHTIIPLSEYVVFLETNLGPFTGNRFAPWSPVDITSGEGRRFAERLREIAARGSV